MWMEVGGEPDLDPAARSVRLRMTSALVSPDQGIVWIFTSP